MKSTLQLIGIGTIGLCFLAGCQQKPVDVKEPTGTSRYKQGQVWTYKTRPGEEKSRITVLKVQFRHQGSTIVHIGIDKIFMRNRFAVGGYVKSVPHLAITEPALNQTVLQLEDTKSGVEPPSVYKTWRKSFRKGRATVETRPVATILALREKALAPRKDSD